MSTKQRNKTENCGTAWHIRGTIYGTLAAIAATWSAPAQAATEPTPIRFICDAVSVWDGDGPIICADGRKIRLAGINTRELDGSCRKGHPCPTISGRLARRELVRLLGGARGTTRHGRRRHGHIRVNARLSCAVTGFSYGRVTAFCRTAQNIDLSCAMVASGHAAIWQRHWAGHRCSNPTPISGGM
jgi:endonuclease YncB( thermonuclease family)